MQIKPQKGETGTSILEQIKNWIGLVLRQLDNNLTTLFNHCLDHNVYGKICYL